MLTGKVEDVAATRGDGREGSPEGPGAERTGRGRRVTGGRCEEGRVDRLGLGAGGAVG